MAANPPSSASKFNLESLPGRLPATQISDFNFNPTDIENIETVVGRFIQSFPDFDANSFAHDALWRDSYGLTGTMRTFYSRPKIADLWSSLCRTRGVSQAKLVPASAKPARVRGQSSWLECQFTFTTSNPPTECSGFLSLSLVSSAGTGKWEIWVLRTILEQLSGHGDVDVLKPCSEYILSQEINDLTNSPVDNSHSTNGTINGLTNTCNASTNDPLQSVPVNHGSINRFYAVVIGGGQCGLSTGGRLQALGVPYVILERNEQVGDAWRLRYKSARLHTIREYSHLPFDRTFGPEYPEFMGKEDLAKGHRKWAEKFGINVWLSTKIESGHWDGAQGLYALSVRKNGVLSQIVTKHVIIATGAGSQIRQMPDLPGKELFHGRVMHSADYVSADGWRDMSGIVVGTANTGHDVADDMVEMGMSVTMVQRNRTYVLPVEYMEPVYKVMYNSEKPTELSDRNMFTNPIAVSRLVSAANLHAMARAQPERWDALERAGFKVDPYGDIQDAVNNRLGGHYIDVGTSAKISNGLIKMKSDAAAISYTREGLRFSDGIEVKADVIVFATGFAGNLKQDVQQIFGEKVADRAGDCFGVDSDGEVLGAFKPLRQPGLWYIGGALGHARWFSRFLSLSIKADQVGTPLPVYSE